MFLIKFYLVELILLLRVIKENRSIGKSKLENIKIVSANGQKIVRKAMRVMKSWERVASVEKLFEVGE